MSEVSVGSIIAYLKMDRSDYDKEIDAAGAKADALARHSPDIKIKVSSATALTQLSTVAAAVRRLQDAEGQERVAEQRLQDLRAKSIQSGAQYARAEEAVERARRAQAQATVQLASAYKNADAQNKKLSQSTAEAKRGLTLMNTALTLGAPAAATLGVVGIGAMAGLAGSAGVALTAILGVNSEIKRGTPLGQQYKASFAPVVGEFTMLKQISAAGVFDGINKGISSSRSLFPALNRDAALLSSNLGAIAGHAGAGVAALLTQLNPLFVTLGNQLVSGSAKFEQWATSSDAVHKLVGFVETELPTAGHFLAELATAGGHVVQALMPLGTTGLSGLTVLLRLLNALPVGVLSTAVPLIASLALGVKALNSANNAASSIGKLSSKMSAAGGVAGSAAGLVGTAGKAVSALGVAGLGASVALGVVSAVMGQQSQSAAQARAQIDSYTQALLASNLAIDNNVRSTIAKKLSDDNSFYAGKQLGLSQKTLTDAVLGNKDAIDQVNVAMDRGRAAVKDYEDNGVKPASGSAKDLQNSINRVNGSINGQVAAFKDAKREAADQKAAIDGVNAAQQQSAVLTKQSASALGLQSGAYLAAKQAADSAAASTKQQTANLIYASDAAGLLKIAMDALNGKELSVSQSTTQYDSALLALTKSLHDNGKTVADNTDKGVANRQAVEQSISAAQAQAQAIANASHSTSAGTAAYQKSGKAILDHIAKMDGDKSAADRAKDSVYQFAQQLLGLNKIKVKPTRIDVNISDAEQHIRTLQGLLASLNQNMESGASKTARNQLAKPPAHAAGGLIGLVSGPGSGTSDSILSYLSNGEYVMPTAAVSKYGRAFFDNVNALKAPTSVTTVSAPYSGGRAAQPGSSAAGREQASAPTINVYPRASQSEYEVAMQTRNALSWAAASA
jgi:hypothetical protein